MVLTNLALSIGIEVDTLLGIEGAHLTGGAGANRLNASAFTAGGVTLLGLDGADILRGGSKNDVGRRHGNDELRGFTGSDTYVFNLDEALGADTIFETSGVASGHARLLTQPTGGCVHRPRGHRRASRRPRSPDPHAQQWAWPSRTPSAVTPQINSRRSPGEHAAWWIGK